MKDENETWLIETGDDVIKKISREGIAALSDLEKAIYCFWVIDYSVSNSGTLDEIQDLYPGALKELGSIAKSQNWPQLSNILEEAENERAFCTSYNELFDDRCEALICAYNHSRDV